MAKKSESERKKVERRGDRSWFPQRKMRKVATATSLVPDGYFASESKENEDKIEGVALREKCLQG